MSKRVSKAASQELAFLAALESIHADVDTSEIAEIQDWSGAIRGKFYGASIEKPSRLSKLKAGLLSALKRPKTVHVPGPSSGGFSGAVPAVSSNVVSHGNLQYSQLAIPELIAVCASESSEEAWIEFWRRSLPAITNVVTKTVRRFGKVSGDLVDDLIQDVYLKLCTNNFRILRNVEILHESSFFGLLKVVAANTVQDYFRSAHSSKMGGGHEPVLLESDLVLPKHAPSSVASSDPERRVLLGEIDTILKTLSHKPNFKRDYAIFWLYFREGLPAKEIAELPDIKLSVKGVERVLHRLTLQIMAALDAGDEKPSL